MLVVAVHNIWNDGDWSPGNGRSRQQHRTPTPLHLRVCWGIVAAKRLHIALHSRRALRRSHIRGLAGRNHMPTSMVDLV